MLCFFDQIFELLGSWFRSDRVLLMIPSKTPPPSSSSQVAAALQKNPKSSVSFFPMRCSSGSKNKSYDYKRLLVA